MVTVVRKGSSKKALKTIISRAKKSPSSKALDAHRFCGKVKFKKDGLALQKKWRDEWE